ncbi:MAG: Hsp20 family protein [Acidobacteria bacterium]|nr:Hsp20 family protein [Acidobacteriota bacterium]MCI0724045.1 Hsp20 family protein [Acidobacteriota bacterium]
MTNRSTTQASAVLQPVSIQTNPTAVIDRTREVYESLSRPAYDLFESRSHQHGHDLEDWLCAESELLCPVPIEIKWSSEQVTVRAEVPGFTAPEIEISAEPRRLFISGKRTLSAEQTTEETACTEQRSKEMFREIELPAEVDPSQATAILKDGVLNITLPKTVSSQAARA